MPRDWFARTVSDFRHSPSLSIIALLSLCGVIAVQAISTNQIAGPVWEEVEYIHMASGLRNLSDTAPMAYRLLPAKIVAALPFDVNFGFRLLNWFFLCVTVVASVIWLQVLGVSLARAAAAVALLMATLTIKMTIFWTYGADSTAWAFQMLGLIAAESGAILSTTVLLALGSLAREATALVFVALAARVSTEQAPTTRRWAALALALAALALLRVGLVVAIPVQGDYSYIDTVVVCVRAHFWGRGLIRTAFLLPLIFGMLLWPIILDARGSFHRMRKRWDLTLFAFLTMLLGLVGGSAIDRLVFPIFPVALWLFATSARIPTTALEWLILAAGQLILMRLWLHIPDPSSGREFYELLVGFASLKPLALQMLLFLVFGFLFAVAQQLRTGHSPSPENPASPSSISRA
ncbi:MAG: hypothetical protein FJ118_04650 [Deltaproteobacteria bacterium]|nr:hypothetical protein [Deltaproteobacteria bacterium]